MHLLIKKKWRSEVYKLEVFSMHKMETTAGREAGLRKGTKVQRQQLSAPRPTFFPVQFFPVSRKGNVQGILTHFWLVLLCECWIYRDCLLSFNETELSVKKEQTRIRFVFALLRRKNVDFLHGTYPKGRDQKSPALNCTSTFTTQYSTPESSLYVELFTNHEGLQHWAQSLSTTWFLVDQLWLLGMKYDCETITTCQHTEWVFLCLSGLPSRDRVQLTPVCSISRFFTPTYLTTFLMRLSDRCLSSASGFIFTVKLNSQIFSFLP